MMKNITAFSALGRGPAWLCFATLMLAAPRPEAKALPVDSRWKVYQVVALEEVDEDDFNFAPEIGGVIHSRSRVYASERAGKPVYIMEKEDELRKGERVLWNFVLDPDMGLMRLEDSLVSRSGNVVGNTWFEYRDPMYAYPKDLCYMYTIPIWLMAQDLKKGARYEFNLMLSSDGTPMHMYVNIEEIETVTVPAGTFQCYKAVLEPDLEQILGKWSWAAPLIRPFVPDFFFWMDMKAPHTMVRFEGKFGPVGGTPSQAYELVEILPAEKKDTRDKSAEIP
jgi:hypothetical protein